MRPNHAVFSAWLSAAAVALALAAPLPAAAAVDSPQQLFSAQQFLADPDALLKQFPNGGQQMIEAVRSLAASNPATLNALVGLLGKANDAQADAIGKALGDVAKADAASNPDYAAQIQVAVVVANNNAVALAAFNAAIGGDIQLSAVTGGGGGGGGGGSTSPPGGGGGTFNAPTFNLTTSVTNTPNSSTVNAISNSVSQ